MPDNWNNLAEMLGTPSIDPLQRKTAPSTPSQPKTEESRAVSSPPVSEPKAAKSVGEIQPEHELLDDLPAMSPEESKPKDQKSRLRSTWDAVAEFFGVPTANDDSDASDSATVDMTTPSSPKSESRGESSKKARPKSMWGFDEEIPRHPSQQVSDQLLGKRDAPAPRVPQNASASDDLETLLAGFKQKPAESDSVDKVAREERSVARTERPRTQRGSTSESRSADRSGQRAPRSKTSMFSADEPVPPASDSRFERSSGAEEVRRPRPEFADDDEQPARRGRRRKPRREIALEESGEVVSREPLETDGKARSRDDQQIEESEPRGGRRPRRGRRSERSEEAADSVSSDSPRRERPARKSSAWDEPLIELNDEDSLDTADEIEGARDDEDGDGAPRRRRRRRRRGGARETQADEVASTGRQIYGRHIEDDEDVDEAEGRTGVVVSWIEAISVVVDKNMDNHRHTPANNHRGRGGRGRGGNDRGGSDRGNNDRRR